MLIRRRSLLASCGIALALPVAAVQVREYPHTYRSARFLGRGGAGIADATDEEAIFYNPAALARGEGIFRKLVLLSPHLDISKSVRDLAEQIGNQSRDPTETLRAQIGVPQHLGGNFFSGLILRRAAVGGYIHSRNTGYIYKDPERGALESVYAHGVTDSGLSFAAAEQFSGKWRVGATVRYAQRSEFAIEANAAEASRLFRNTDNDQILMIGTATAVDLGFSWHRDWKRGGAEWALTVADLGGTAFKPLQPTTLPRSERPLHDASQTVNLGARFQISTQLSTLRLVGDVRDLFSATGLDWGKRLFFGTDLSLSEWFGVAAGLHQGYATMGTFVDLGLVRIDLGGYTEEVGRRSGQRGDVRYYLRLMAGI